MQTDFGDIIQMRYSQSYEDVFTDALAYILNSHVSARQGMMKILRNLLPNIPDLRYKTQLAKGSIRPYMWGYAGSEIYIYVENKFWLGLTDHQPLSYLNELAKYPHQTLLLIIVPGDREKTMIAELTRKIIDADITLIKEKIKNEEIVWFFKTNLGPSFALTSWPRIIEFLKKESGKDTVAQNDLELFQALYAYSER